MDQQRDTQILERGSVYFAYRPKADKGAAHGLKDVYQTFMILEPQQGRRRYRLIVMGHKELPEPIPGDKRKYWGFVFKVASNPRAIVRELEQKTSKSKTSNEREWPAARPAGEGVYALARLGDQVHLAYQLELPEHPGQVQHDLHIQSAGSFICSVRNPLKGAPGGPGMPTELRANYVPQVQALFNDRALIGARPELLDVEGCEFILLPGVDNPERELNIQLNPRHETEETAEIFTDLHLVRAHQPVEPLLTGEWR